MKRESRSFSPPLCRSFSGGLIGVYGHPEKATDVPPEKVEAVLQSMKQRALEDSVSPYEPAPDLPPAEAEEVLRSIENWTSRFAPIWFISTTPDGDAVLAADG
jgi:hypothetical protein